MDDDPLRCHDDRSPLRSAERAARRSSSLRGELVPGRAWRSSTHMNADGDGCGSESALARLLAQRGSRRAHRESDAVARPVRLPARRRRRRPHRAGVDGAARTSICLIVLDISDVKRLGVLDRVGARARRPEARHRSPHRLRRSGRHADRARDTTACATGELVYDLATVLGFEITPAIARALYTAMLTDTGGFRFSNTSPRCHAVAGQLLACGVDPGGHVHRGSTRRRRRAACACWPRCSARCRWTRRTGSSWLSMQRRRAREVRRAVGGSRRHRRARAVDRGNAHGAVLPRPRLRQGEGVVPQHRRDRRQRVRAPVRRRRPREGVGRAASPARSTKCASA